MEKWTQNFSSRLTRMHRRFESLLENDVQKKNPEAPPFEPSRDVALVEGLPLGLPDDHIDKAVILFSRLALCFDQGILLENQDGAWRAQATFQEGLAKPLQKDLTERLSLPDIKSVDVIKTPSSTLLKKIGLEKDLRAVSSSAYLMRPVPDFAFVVFSTLPDLWLKAHLELVSKALNRGFAE